MKQRNWIIPSCFLLAGLLMITLGIIRGEHETVLAKAIKICLECMGIG